MQDDDGQVTEAHSVSAGLDYPGSGPEHAHLRDSGRARYVAVDRRRRARRVPRGHAAGGHHPGARDLARAALRAARGRRRLDARPRLPVGPRRQGPRRGHRARCRHGVSPRATACRRSSRPATTSIATAFAARAGPRRADAVPHGRLPGHGDVAARSASPTPTTAPTSSSSASRTPTRSPTARSSTPPAPRRCAPARRSTACSSVAEQLSRRLPVVLMCYVNLVLARTPDGFAAAARAAGVSGLIVPDLPLEEARRDRARRARRTASRSCRSSRRRRPTSACARSAREARGFLYTVSVIGTTGERDGGEDAYRAILARVKEHADVPVAIGFGISTPEQAAAAARAGRRRRDRRHAARARRRRGRRSRRRGRRARCGTCRRAHPLGCRAQWDSSSPPPSRMVIWIVLWAIGVKSIDALHDRDGRSSRSRATVRILKPYLPGRE